MRVAGLTWVWLAGLPCTVAGAQGPAPRPAAECPADPAPRARDGRWLALAPAVRSTDAAALIDAACVGARLPVAGDRYQPLDRPRGGSPAVPGAPPLAPARFGGLLAAVPAPGVLLSAAGGDLYLSNAGRMNLGWRLYPGWTMSLSRLDGIDAQQRSSVALRMVRGAGTPPGVR